MQLQKCVKSQTSSAAPQKCASYAKESTPKNSSSAQKKEFCTGCAKKTRTKNFYLAYEGAICPNMKLTTLDRLYASLKEEKNVVKVPEAVAKKARASLERMFQVKS